MDRNQIIGQEDKKNYMKQIENRLKTDTNQIEDGYKMDSNKIEIRQEMDR